MSFLTISAYQFIDIDNPLILKKDLSQICCKLGLRGTVLLAYEGINCFVAGKPTSVWAFKDYLEKVLKFSRLCYKEHPCDEIPFTRLLIKIKKEIISMGVPELKPNHRTAPYISPKTLKSWLDQNKDFVLLDTRNKYEIEVGTFANSIDLNIDTFREFPKSLQSLSDSIKDKPVVLFCTGGIRCEKASSLFIQNGFNEVYQLEGGILKYFEECDSSHFRGNCFVFDWRLSVDSKFRSHPRSSEEPVNSGRHRIKIKSSEDLN